MCAFHINDLALQSIEFNVIKDLAALGEIIFQQKQKSLLDEKRKLNELHFKVWNNENTICDDVWKFSQEHDFYTILKQYDDDTEKRNEKIKHGRDIEWVNISELNYEIEAIEQEIYYLTENDLKEKNLMEALKDLEAAQRFSKENNDVKSLVRAIENSRQEILAIECAIEKYMKVEENNKIILPSNNFDIKDERVLDKSKEPYTKSRINISNNKTNINNDNDIIAKKKRKKSIPLPKNMSKLEFMTPATVAMNNNVEINTVKNKSKLSSEHKDLLRKSSYLEKRSSRDRQILGNSAASSDQKSFISASYEKHDFITAKAILTNNNSIRENNNTNTVQHAVSRKHIAPIILSPSSFLIALKNTISIESYNDNELGNSHRNSEINELTKQSNTKSVITSSKYIVKKRSIISLKLAERRLKLASVK